MTVSVKLTRIVVTSQVITIRNLFVRQAVSLIFRHLFLLGIGGKKKPKIEKGPTNSKTNRRDYE